MKCFRLAIVALGLAIFSTTCVAVGAETHLAFGGAKFVERRLLRASGDVSYFATEWPKGAPLVVLIQGSGCQPVFVKGKNGVYSTFFGLLDFAQRKDIGLLVVSKPNSPAQPVSGGGVKNCPVEFHQTFSLDSWSSAVSAAISDWRIHSKKPGGSVRLLGVSEGAVVAAKIASELTNVDRVALVGFSGSTQAFDEILSAYKSEASADAISASVEAVGLAVSEIMKDPTNSEKFYRGHPYLRWSSFLLVDPTDYLLRSTAKVLLVSGTEDASVPVESTERAWVTLLAGKHDVEFRRLSQADHGLVRPGDSGMDGVTKQYLEICEWLAGKPTGKPPVVGAMAK